MRQLAVAQPTSRLNGSFPGPWSAETDPKQAFNWKSTAPGSRRSTLKFSHCCGLVSPAASREYVAMGIAFHCDHGSVSGPSASFGASLGSTSSTMRKAKARADDSSSRWRTLPSKYSAHSPGKACGSVL